MELTLLDAQKDSNSDFKKYNNSLQVILFFGPYSPPVHGQSMAFKSVVDHWDGLRYLVDTTRFRYAFINTLYASLKVIWLFLFKRDIKTVYFTCTRSVFGGQKDIVLLWLCGISRVRVVNHLHGSDFKRYIDNSPIFFKRLLHHVYKYVDVSIVLTNSMKEEFLAFPEMKIEVVKNFYSNHFDRETLPVNSILTVTFYSNLLFSKGVLDFLEAAKKIVDPDILFQVAGRFTSDEFKSAKSIKKEIKKVLLENPELNIEFHGSIPINERFDFLAKSDILILPTFYESEGIPLSIIEAMRCGNVIIATDFKSIPELVKPENGVLVPMNKPAEISREIENFKSNKEKLRAIQEHNVRVAKEEYTEARYIKEIYSIINS